MFSQIRHCYHSWQPGKTPTWWKILVWICLYCFNCTKFGLLILRKIIKIVATRCHILRLKCTKFDFGWGSAPDPAGGAYSAPPDPLAALRGPTSKREGGDGGEEGEGKGGEGEGREGEEEGEGKKRGGREGERKERRREGVAQGPAHARAGSA